MVNFRIIARAFSQILIVEGLFMLITAGVSILLKEPASPFFYSAIITLVTGILVFTPLRNEERVYSPREGYIIVTGLWLIFALFSTLPFLLSGAANSFTDAFFESMAGYTTTNATIFTDIGALPYSVLFWRSLIQWLGGIGLIIISLSVLPVVKTINIQLSTTEFTGQPGGKIHPKILGTAKRLIMIYVIITVAEVLLLLLGGMTIFDAVCHSFSTISTGGFSVRTEGIAAFTSPFIRVVITFFMFIAGTNMTMIYFAFKRNFRKITDSNEFFFYLVISIIFSVIVILLLVGQSGQPAGRAIIDGTFHVISYISTTGFYTQDFHLWGSSLILITLILMFVGGMSGSTTGGIKILKFLIIAKNSRHEFKRLIHPNAVIPVRIGKKPVPEGIVYNLLVFFVLYLLVICVGSLFVSLMGYDLITSFSTSASMLGNIGPAIGEFGPFSNYADVPSAGKWFFSAFMLIGRLELLAVIILFTRSFYKR